MIDVVSFYDEHPINERSVLAALEREGKSLDDLVPEDLYAHDQDHYGHLEAVDKIADRLGLTAGQSVLDVCCGMGGPARYLALRREVSVAGVDLNANRIAGAERLTDLVGLADKVSFRQGDATDLPFDDDQFDAAYSQEAFLHIPDKSALLAELRRVIRPAGGLCFTDWTAGDGLESDHLRRLSEGFAAGGILGVEDYRQHLTAAGFEDIESEDISGWWREILVQRLELFRSMEADTVREFGRQRHETYVDNYVFFVDCMTEKRLGGVRFLAH